MPLHPNIHLLIPSGASNLIETRLYLPAAATSTTDFITTSSQSTPRSLAELGQSGRDAVRNLGITKVVTAAHPWARLGGNMMFPVVAHHVPVAIFASSSASTTAYATFNVPGVGHSTGSMPWPGFGLGGDAAAFADVESAVARLVSGNPVDLYRVGYSYGTNLALNASITDPIKRTLLISPAPTLFKAMSLFSGPTFAAGLENALDRSEAAQVGTETASGQALSGNSNSNLWLVFGDADDFTGAATLRALGGRRKDLVAMVEIPGCGHFYARDQDGVELRKAVTEWISCI